MKADISPCIQQPATCLTLALVAGAVLGFIMNLDNFGCDDLDKPLVAILSLSWFPWALTKFHRVKSTEVFWGFAILVSFVGWDAIARIVSSTRGITRSATPCYIFAAQARHTGKSA